MRSGLILLCLRICPFNPSTLNLGVQGVHDFILKGLMLYLKVPHGDVFPFV